MSGQNGKGSKRRPSSKPGAYEDGYDAIRWETPKQRLDRLFENHTGRLVVENYSDPPQEGWIIPSLDDILREERK